MKVKVMIFLVILNGVFSSDKPDKQYRNLLADSSDSSDSSESSQSQQSDQQQKREKYISQKELNDKQTALLRKQLRNQEKLTKHIQKNHKLYSDMKKIQTHIIQHPSQKQYNMQLCSKKYESKQNKYDDKIQRRTRKQQRNSKKLFKLQTLRQKFAHQEEPSQSSTQSEGSPTQKRPDEQGFLQQKMQAFKKKKPSQSKVQKTQQQDQVFHHQNQKGDQAAQRDRKLIQTGTNKQQEYKVRRFSSSSDEDEHTAPRPVRTPTSLSQEEEQTKQPIRKPKYHHSRQFLRPFVMPALTNLHRIYMLQADQ